MNKTNCSCCEEWKKELKREIKGKGASWGIKRLKECVGGGGGGEGRGKHTVERIGQGVSEKETQVTFSCRV